MTEPGAKRGDSGKLCLCFSSELTEGQGHMRDRSSHPGSMPRPLWTLQARLISLPLNIFQWLPKSFTSKWNRLGLLFKAFHILTPMYVSGLLRKRVKHAILSLPVGVTRAVPSAVIALHFLSPRLTVGGPARASPRMTSVRKWGPDGPFLYPYGISFSPRGTLTHLVVFVHCVSWPALLGHELLEGMYVLLDLGYHVQCLPRYTRHMSPELKNGEKADPSDFSNAI